MRACTQVPGEDYLGTEGGQFEFDLNMQHRTSHTIVIFLVLTHGLALNAPHALLEAALSLSAECGEWKEGFSVRGGEVRRKGCGMCVQFVCNFVQFCAVLQSTHVSVCRLPA